MTSLAVNTCPTNDTIHANNDIKPLNRTTNPPRSSKRHHHISQPTLRRWANNANCANASVTETKESDCTTCHTSSFISVSDSKRRTSTTQKGSSTPVCQQHPTKHKICSVKSKICKDHTPTPSSSRMSAPASTSNAKAFSPRLERVLDGVVEEVVVMHKDRLWSIWSRPVGACLPNDWHKVRGSRSR